MENASQAKKGKVAAVIVAAGRGERAGRGEGPKQYRKLGPDAIIARTLRTFLDHPDIGRIVVAIHPEDSDLFAAAAGDLASRVIVVTGGGTRQESVLLALSALRGAPPASVLIHDAVRPFADARLIGRVIEGIEDQRGSLPAMPVVETLKRATDDGHVDGTVDRSGLHAAQTPQGFPFAAILDAHERAHAATDREFTDDASIAEWAGMPVKLVAGDSSNVKLTFARDIEMAQQRATTPAFPDVRTGNGYDVHAFEPGSFVTLCGVRVPHSKRLVGHSDADVALHALTDALLATCGEGDIGTHFPPSDPQWRGAASRIFVEHAAALVRGRGGRIANADITLISEAPRIGPHRAAMTAALAEMLGISPDRISIKATTNEKLGFIGREEGIAAIATASVIYPGDVPA
ncbi:MAG: bifunctional 2-C-methyl-D-erythritol 4-phosphate cytidylyltransferase/2-C-methyl-D-erythritol 2,4-cyclodiphosphate synthase [Rhizobiaceae bacterium]|nr:bifunctional 2-C-methyl-D-erythritol 4-phosphate cytidylyltransferase/2-C-methyl-D-erythritol 2,4-cyclodiphosphate synthase [Rhizobiaceae bacterium]